MKMVDRHCMTMAISFQLVYSAGAAGVWNTSHRRMPALYGSELVEWYYADTAMAVYEELMKPLERSMPVDESRLPSNTNMLVDHNLLPVTTTNNGDVVYVDSAEPATSARRSVQEFDTLRSPPSIRQNSYKMFVRRGDYIKKFMEKYGINRDTVMGNHRYDVKRVSDV